MKRRIRRALIDLVIFIVVAVMAYEGIHAYLYDGQHRQPHVIVQVD